MNLYGEILTEALQGREAEMTRRGGWMAQTRPDFPAPCNSGHPPI